MKKSTPITYGFHVVLGLALLSGFAYALVDDRQITIRSAADVTNKRQALIQFIWGSDGFPSDKLPSSVTLNVPSPVRNLTNLERVDTLRIGMDAGQEGLAHHFIPQQKNNRLVVLHHGHACSFDDSSVLADQGFGMQRTINALLIDGYSVLTAYMPHMRPDDCGSISHDRMFSTISLPTGSPMKFFLEPVAVSLNYLQTMYEDDGFPVYQDFSMVGLSGGGWTTTVYAAIDPTIQLSIPVAGTIPLYLRSGGSVGDAEQTLSAFYQIAGYPDLYVLGSYGSGRKQVQILNRRDDCCFGQAQHSVALTGMSYDQAMRNVESQVRIALFNLGSVGFFRLEIDEAAPSHMISLNAIVNVILSELNGGRKYIGAASSTDAFVRGMNGHLWHNGPGGWEDTGFAMVGVSAVLQGVVNRFDVFYRNPSNELMRAYWTGSAWATQPMTAGPCAPADKIITDPAVASWGPGRFDVIALGRDYTPYHWWWNGRLNCEQVSGSARGLGPPSLVTWGPNRLDLFFRAWDRSITHMRSNGSAPWALETVATILVDFPSAVATAGATLRVYAKGRSRQVWEALQVSDGPWQWTSLSAVTDTIDTPLAGSPSASVQGGVIRVYVRTSDDTLSTFTLSGSWSFLDNGGSVTGSPTATPGGALVRGPDAGLWLFDGTSWIARSGIFN